jgi:nucleoside-diphosphate-sugar epimerase
MLIALRKAAILGATGPAGWYLARELATAGVAVRVVSRSERNLAATFGDRFERRVADLLGLAQTRTAIEGCDVAFDCLGVPMDRISDHALAARALASAAKGAGCRVVQVSSFWAYLPLRTLPLNESHPREGGPPPVRARREAEDILQHAGAAVVHLPDFFGPRVHVSTLQQALREAADRKTVRWIGGRDLRRDYCYVPDAMASVARLATREEAYGERWIVPGSGPTSIREIAALLERHLGRRVHVQTAGPLMLRIAALFARELRPLLPIVPLYAQPIEYDASKLRRLLGELPVTPYERAIPATLDSLSRPSLQ